MANTAKTITVIPATINPRTHLPELAAQKRRVAGYARVSTDKDEQFTSYEAQVEYYTQFIQRNPDWQYVDVYTDEGLSGLNTKKRKGFNDMISDALAGKIDLIITKSVSRFARNTVDSLSTIRELKAHNVEVYFEKENIYTFDGKGELLLTIMSSLAQEESRSISENVTWGQRRRFEEGRVSFAYSNFLGYDKNPGKGKCLPPVINPEQAETVKLIYNLFMQGKTTWTIAKMLTEAGLKTPRGKDKWSVSTVESILTNEKYKGAAILQKKFTSDYLTKTMKVNEGEYPQYYVENNHEAIIQPDEWDMVQKEFARRKAMGRSYSGNSIFSAKIICGDCGSFFGAKVWNSTSDKYRRTVWQCNSKFKGEQKCTTPHLDEKDIRARFIEAYNQLLQIKDLLIAKAEEVKASYTDCTELDERCLALKLEMEDVAELTRRYVAMNASSAQDQKAFTAQYNSYVERFDAAEAQLKELEKERMDRQSRVASFDTFITALKRSPESITEFDERIWQTAVDRVTVYHDGHMTFRFLNGTEIDK